MSVYEEGPLTPDSGSNGANGAVVSDLLAQMQRVDGWHELESDPGLFTALINDFGCDGVAVEEIYDLEQPFREAYPNVYGYIFLYNVVEERRGRRAPNSLAMNQHSNTSPSSLFSGEFVSDEDFVKRMFFAYQKVHNSCASHAIISVLLNVKNIKLGAILQRLKVETKDMCPEDKGYAIGNIKEIAQAHNQRAQIDMSSGRNSNVVRLSQRTTSAAEAFHFVCFLPIEGRLIELDGLKENPIDHGECKDEDWTAKLQRLIRNRIQSAHKDHDIRYNLMAVIPDPCKELEKKINRCQRVHSHLYSLLERIAPLCKIHYFNTKHHDLYLRAKNRPEMQKTIGECQPVNDELKMDDESVSYVLNWNGLQIPKNIDSETPKEEDVETATVSNASQYEFEDDDYEENDKFFEAPARHFLFHIFDNSRIIAQIPERDATQLPDENEEKENECGVVIQNEMERILSEFKLVKDDQERKKHVLYSLFQDLQKILPIIQSDLESYCRSLTEIKKTRRDQRVDVERRVHNMDEFLTTFLGFMSYANLLHDLPEFRDSPPEVNENGKTVLEQKNLTSAIHLTEKKVKTEDGGWKITCPSVLLAGAKAKALLEELESTSLLTPNVDLEKWKMVSS